MFRILCISHAIWLGQRHTHTVHKSVYSKENYGELQLGFYFGSSGHWFYQCFRVLGTLKVGPTGQETRQMTDRLKTNQQFIYIILTTLFGVQTESECI